MLYEDATPGTRVTDPKLGPGTVVNQDYYSRVKVDVVFDSLHPDYPAAHVFEQCNVADLHPG